MPNCLAQEKLVCRPGFDSGLPKRQTGGHSERVQNQADNVTRMESLHTYLKHPVRVNTGDLKMALVNSIQRKICRQKQTRLWLARCLLPVLPVLLVLGSYQTASAETYFSVDGSRLTFETDADDDLASGGLRFRMGTQLTTLIDVETQIGFSFNNDTQSFDSFGATFFGGYLKGYAPLGKRSAVFGLVGFTALSLTQDIGSSEFSEDRGGFSWGFGMETQLTRNTDLTADFMSYIRDDGLFENISAVNVGIKLYF